MNNQVLPTNTSHYESSTARAGNFTNPVEQMPGPSTRIVLYSIVLVFSLVGNTLVIVVVGWDKKLRTIFNLFIVNMAVSDLVIPMLALPIKITDIARGMPFHWDIDGPLGNALCKLCFFFTDISPAVSVFTLVIITVNRFVAIVFPLRHGDIFYRKSCLIMIASTWIAAAALFSPYFYVFRTTNEYASYTQCLMIWSPAFDDERAFKIFVIIVIVMVFFIPSISITLLYSIMLYKLRKGSRSVAKMLGSREVSARKKRDQNIFNISVAIIVAFAMLWGPFFGFMLVSTCQIVRFLRVQFDTIFFAVQYIGYLNSVINPIIYFLFIDSFRMGLKRILYRKCLRKRFLSLNRTAHEGNSKTADHPATIQLMTMNKLD